MTYLFYCFKVFVFVFVFAGLVVEILFKCGPVPLGLSPHLKYFGQRPAWWKKHKKYFSFAIMCVLLPASGEPILSHSEQKKLKRALETVGGFTNFGGYTSIPAIKRIGRPGASSETSMRSLDPPAAPFSANRARPRSGRRREPPKKAALPNWHIWLCNRQSSHISRRTPPLWLDRSFVCSGRTYISSSLPARNLIWSQGGQYA